MSAAPRAAGAAAWSEQRSRHRYPLELELEYRLLEPDGTRQRSGRGRTTNISSCGALFRTEDALPAQGRIELLLSWPLLLEGACPLKLVFRGRIVRKTGDLVAVQTKEYEFRTAGARALKGQAQGRSADS